MKPCRKNSKLASYTISSTKTRVQAKTPGAKEIIPAAQQSKLVPLCTLMFARLVAIGWIMEFCRCSVKTDPAPKLSLGWYDVGEARVYVGLRGRAPGLTMSFAWQALKEV